MTSKQLATDGEFFEAYGAPAFTDPLANTVHLRASASDGDRVFAGFCDGAFPPDFLAPFLHEAWHHMCMDSPVGGVLLGIEALPRMIWTERVAREHKSETDCDGSPVCHNAAVTRQLVSLLGPLAEGVALFGELDATPGASDAVSTPSLNANSLFFHSHGRAKIRQLILSEGPSALLNGRFPWPQYAEWLSERRSEPSSAFQKTRHLLETAAVMESRPQYAVGFRWVRGLVDRLSAASPLAAHDSDAALLFVASYFFRDWKLAELAVRMSITMMLGGPSVSLVDVADYIRRRAEEFSRPAIGDVFEDFTRSTAAGHGDQHPCLNFSPERYEMLQEIYAQAGARSLYWMSAKDVNSRHLLRVASVKIDSIVCDSKTHQVRWTIGGRFASCPILPLSQPANGKYPVTSDTEELPGTAEIIMFGNQPVLCLFLGNTVLAVLSRELEPIPTDLAEKVFGDIRPVAHLEFERRQMLDVVVPHSRPVCEEFLRTRRVRAVDAWGAVYA